MKTFNTGECSQSFSNTRKKKERTENKRDITRMILK